MIKDPNYYNDQYFNGFQYNSMDLMDLMVYFHGIADYPNGTSAPWRIYKEYVLLFFLGVS